MNIELNPLRTEEIADAEDVKFKFSYEDYQSLGGTINEADCQSAFDRMKNPTESELNNPQIQTAIRQGENIAKIAGIVLEAQEKGNPDPRVLLYAFLRTGIHPEEVKDHHTQMGDQPLFGEVLKMLGDKESLEKLIEAYPNIFK